MTIRARAVTVLVLMLTCAAVGVGLMSTMRTCYSVAAVCTSQPDGTLFCQSGYCETTDYVNGIVVGVLAGLGASFFVIKAMMCSARRNAGLAAIIYKARRNAGSGRPDT